MRQNGFSVASATLAAAEGRNEHGFGGEHLDQFYAVAAMCSAHTSKLLKVPGHPACATCVQGAAGPRLGMLPMQASLSCWELCASPPSLPELGNSPNGRRRGFVQASAGAVCCPVDCWHH